MKAFHLFHDHLDRYDGEKIFVWNFWPYIFLRETEIFSNYLINKFRNRNTCMTNRIVKNAINY